MQWNDLIGHSQQRQWIERAVGRNRLANTFLFLGPDGVGKRTFALLLAKSLLCHRAPADRLQPCGACPDCAQVEAHTHPDLIEIAKPADRSSLSIDQIIGPEDARHTQGLCYEIGLRPYRGRRKIAIIDDADFLTVECANSMLKTLEEPPANSVLILLSASLQRQLPTIRSRCQIVRFFPLCAADLAQLIQRQGLCDSQEQALRVAEQCDGGLGMVRTLVGGDLPAFRQQLFQLLAQPQLNIVDLAKRLGQFTDEAGKEASLKRMRLKLLLKMAADFYRCVGGWTISLTEGIATDHDEAMQTLVQRRLQHWPGGPAAAIVCWQRCLEAIEQVDRNANQAALIEDWSANLAAAGYC